MNEEYVYDIGKYTIGVDKNGEDGIGLTVAIINDNGEIHLLGNCYGDNARCIDLLIKENEQLKENNLAMQEEMARTWAKLQQKEDIINKTKSTINQMLTTGYSKETTYYYPAKNGEFEARAKVLLEILDNKGE